VSVGGAVDDDGDGRICCTGDGDCVGAPRSTCRIPAHGTSPARRGRTSPHKRAPRSSCSVSGAYVRTHPLFFCVLLTEVGMAEDVENAAKSYGVHVKTVYGASMERLWSVYGGLMRCRSTSRRMDL
jgi:hypothetical protein